jgi:cell fate (sporulation/competence/biofilm development) regulator YlbF (YheA/YmcA/DUF963 family)
MNVYDAAHQLARSLSECPEYIAYKEAKEKVKQDLQAEKMLNDLRTTQFEVQTLKLSGKPTDEAEKKLQNLYNIVSCNSLLQNYLEAEERFAVLFSDIQKIILNRIELDINLENNK